MTNLLSLKLDKVMLPSDKQINEMAHKAIIEQLEAHITQSIKRQSTEKRVQRILAEALMAEPEYASLMDGELRGHFGLDAAGRSGVDIVVNEITNRLWLKKINHPKYMKAQKSIQISVGIVFDGRGLANDLIYDNVGTQRIESGENLPWIKWLLEAGNKTIIFHYDYKYLLGKGRSGKGIMVPSSTSTRRRWRVPASFQGTEQNNWVTRALQSAWSRFEDELLNILRE